MLDGKRAPKLLFGESLGIVDQSVTFCRGPLTPWYRRSIVRPSHRITSARDGIIAKTEFRGGALGQGRTVKLSGCGAAPIKNTR